MPRVDHSTCVMANHLVKVRILLSQQKKEAFSIWESLFLYIYNFRRDMTNKNLYIAASSQHVGKTTSTLGITAAFMRAGLSTGYCKPLGQQHVHLKGSVVDKDAILFADLLKLDIRPDVHSPVILGKGATEKFLDAPSRYHLEEKILYAREVLENNHDIIIYEGTGHPGVGSIANLSNARVAKILDAEAIMIVEGGVGSTIDILNLSLSLFREEGVPVAGVIINKVIPDKMEKVRHYVGGWLKARDLRLLGLLPYDKTLAYPLIWTINKAVHGTLEYNKEKGINKIEKILAGSLVDLDSLSKSKDNLLVVSSRVLDEAIKRIIQISTEEEYDEVPLSGIVLTGDDPVTEYAEHYIAEHKLPVIRTQLDTYAVVIKISKLEVKINRRTPWKIAKAIELINSNVDMGTLFELTTNRSRS